MDDHAEATTFRSIAQEQGIVIPEPLPQDWPLEQWFASVVDTPLAEFSAVDLARACRQRMFHEHVVPYALAVLRQDPLAGDSYDGELLSALLRLPQDYWDTHHTEKGVLRAVMMRAYVQTEDAELKAEIMEFRLERV